MVVVEAQEWVVGLGPEPKRVAVGSICERFEDVVVSKPADAASSEGNVVLKGNRGSTCCVVHRSQSDTSDGPQIDLRVASAPGLKALQKIGGGRAVQIVAHRAPNGPFHAIEDLDRVLGIGPATIEAIRYVVTVGS